MVTHGAVLLGQFEGALSTPSSSSLIWSKIVSQKRVRLLRPGSHSAAHAGPRGRFPQSLCKARSAPNRCLEGLVAPGSALSVGELKPPSLAFRGWSDTRSHQLGTQPGFMFLLTLEPFYWVFTKVADACKGKAGFPQLTFSR